MKKYCLILLALAVCFIISCADSSPSENPGEDIPVYNQDPPVTEQPEPEPEPQPEPEPETPENKYFSELSGLEIPQEIADLRPVAVMINNNSFSLPQSGISNADIIFECEAEGGETRMMALFKPYNFESTIGSVRSARDYFIDFAQIFDAIYVHAGGSPQAYEHIAQRKIQNLDGVNMYLPDCFWRDQERLATASLEHTLVTSGQKIANQIEKLGYRTQLKAEYQPSLTFSQQQYTPDGNDAVYMKIPRAFASEFNFDSQKCRYTHTQHGMVQSDKETGQALEFDNIIVLYASQALLGDSKNRIEVNLTGEGKGYFLTMGKYIPITWQRSDRDSGISISDLQGNSVLLNPGKTFISVVNTYFYSGTTFK